MEPKQHFPDCGTKIGSLHSVGCDVEICPRCGGQAIGCLCIYDVNGMDSTSLEEDTLDIYENGPTEAMCAKWDNEWGKRRIAWDGYWPGKLDAALLGFWCKMVPGKGWVTCEKDDPEATEDLNRLVMKTDWDADTQRHVLSKWK